MKQVSKRRLSAKAGQIDFWTNEQLLGNFEKTK